jgi:seryl-tRNA synthetase
MNCIIALMVTSQYLDKDDINPLYQPDERFSTLAISATNDSSSSLKKEENDVNAWTAEEEALLENALEQHHKLLQQQTTHLETRFLQLHNTMKLQVHQHNKEYDQVKFRFEKMKNTFRAQQAQPKMKQQINK